MDLVQHRFPNGGIVPRREVRREQIDAKARASGIRVMAIDAMAFDEGAGGFGQVGSVARRREAEEQDANWEEKAGFHIGPPMS